MVRARVVILVVLLLAGTLATVLVYQFTNGPQNRTKFLPSYSKQAAGLRYRQEDGWTAESQEGQDGRSNQHQTMGGETVQFNLSRAHQSHIVPDDINRQLENNQQETLRLREERRRLDGEFFQLKQEKRKLEGQRRKLEEGQKALRLQRQLLDEDRKQLAAERIYARRKEQKNPIRSPSAKPTVQKPERLQRVPSLQDSALQRGTEYLKDSKQLQKQSPPYHAKNHKLNPLSVQGANLKNYLRKILKKEPQTKQSYLIPSSQRIKSPFLDQPVESKSGNQSEKLPGKVSKSKALEVDAHSQRVSKYLDQGHFGYLHGTNRKSSLVVMPGNETSGEPTMSDSQGPLEVKADPDFRLNTETGNDASKGAALPPDQLWEGLDPSHVARRYPGIMLDGDYVLRPFIDPTDERASGMTGNPHTLDELTDGQAEERFYQLVTVDHVHCADRQRMGNFGDGGWDMCISGVYKPKHDCLVYSFGINNDFSFDDAIANKYGCQVKAFDPSMSVGDHMHSSRVFFYNLGLGATDGTNSQGWQLRTLSSILKRLNHQDSVIDYLKVDIEFNEWSCFKTILKEHSLKNVKQFVFEIHTSELYNINKPSRKETFYDWYNTLLEIEKQGFRRYNHHYNPNGQYTSVRTGKERTCCYELYYINIRFLKKTKP